MKYEFSKWVHSYPLTFQSILYVAFTRNILMLQYILIILTT